MLAKDIVVVVLASAVALALVMAVGGVVFWGHSISETGGEALVALGGAIIGAISGYIGRGITEKPKDP
jgi:hypothetical protein